MAGRFYMPRVFCTRAVFEAWLKLLEAQFRSGDMAEKRYRERVKQAEEQWQLELRCLPERETWTKYGPYEVQEEATQ